jgi:hypothetical protein
MHVPSSVEDGGGFKPILVVHLLGANHESDIGGTSPKMIHSLVKGRRAARTGVFDVYNRDGLDSNLSQCDLTSDQMLALDDRLGRIREKRSLDIDGLTVRILERLKNGLGYE